MNGCNHQNYVGYYDHGECRDCGWIHTDMDSSWGFAKNKWFSTASVARYFAKHGEYPEDSYENTMAKDNSRVDMFAAAALTGLLSNPSITAQIDNERFYQLKRLSFDIGLEMVSKENAE